MNYLEKLYNKLNGVEFNIDEQDILNFLKNRKRWPKYYPGTDMITVQTITQTSGWNQSFFNQDFFINYDEWKNLYDNGFTTVISDVLDLNEQLRNFNNVIEKEIGAKSCGNFYFGNNREGIKPSWNRHAHDYDVLVKQIYGESSWIVQEKKIILKPQEVLMVPKNTLHQVVKTIGKRLSLTINVL